MFKSLSLEEFYRLINHGPCVFITSGTPEKPNIAPIAWTMPVNDDPPLVAIAISETHYTTELITQTGEFVINVPDLEVMKKYIGSGKVSGKNVDKIKKFGVSLGKGEKIKTPHMEEAIGYLECKVLNKHSYDGVIMFIATVLKAAVKEGLYDGYLVPEKATTAHHLGGGWFLVGEKRIKIS